MKKYRVIGIIGLLSLLVAGYFGYDYHKRHGEAALLGKANQFWDAIRVNDLVTAYNMEAEMLHGTLHPDDVKLRQDWGIRLVSFKLGAITYYGNHAEIELTRELTWPDSKTKTRMKPPIKDTWTFTQGQWYHGFLEKGTSSMRKGPED